MKNRNKDFLIKNRRSGAEKRKASQRKLLLFLFMYLIIAAYGSSTIAQTIFYIPMPEQDLYNSFKQITDAGGATISGPLKSTTSIVCSENGATLYYDHWEDGYETNILAPVQASTTTYSMSAGQILTLSNDVPIPRNPSVILYDGRDKIYCTRALTITRASYPSVPGTVLADASEVLDKSNWDTVYTSPIGVNLATSIDNDMFSMTQLFVMAAENNTLVQVDADGNGTYESSFTLNQGENYRILSINAGGKIKASKVVQATLFTSRLGTKYQNRWFELYPTRLLYNSYYNPVTTTLSDAPAAVFIYNPNAASITVNWTSRTSTGSFSVGSKATYRYDMPSGSGVRFYTSNVNDKFFALGAMDVDLAGNSTYDWGYTLLPETYLTTSLLVGWGPGSADLSVNGNPVWVIPIASTRIYVDYDANPTTGALTDPNGEKYDASYLVAAYESKRIFDPNDRNQTGMRVYTTDGTEIAGAWGADPSSSQCCSPYLDMGNSIPPDQRMIITKESSFITDGNSNGLIDAGDVVEYNIKAVNYSLRPRTLVVFQDVLPSHVTYNAGTTTLTRTNLSDQSVSTTSIPDAANPTTIFPLDEGGYNTGSFYSATKVEVKFRVTANANVNTQNTQTNAATIKTAQGDSIYVTNTMPVNNSYVPCVISFKNNTYASDVTSYSVGSTAYVELTASYMNQNSGSAETVTVTLSNSSTSDQENLTLTETGVNTGVFRASIATSASNGSSQYDGTLKAIIGNTISVSYTNYVYNNTCTDNATITENVNTKQLYLSTDGSGSPDQDLDRVDPVATSDASTATSVLLGSGSGTVTVGSTTYSSNSLSTTLTFSHTPGTGANRLLLVAVNIGSTQLSGANPPPTVTSVTFAGNTMTQVGTAVGSETRSYLFRLTNPQATAGNVVITISSGTNALMQAGATTLNGVDQTTPTGAVAQVGENNAAGSINLTVNPTTSGGIVFSTANADEAVSNQSITVDAGQTSLFEYDGNNYMSSAVSYESGTGGSVTSTYTFGNNQDNAGVAVAVNPASLGVTNTTFTQVPSMCSALSVPAGQTVTASLYIQVESGSMPASPSITGTVTYGANTINLSGASYNSGTGVLTLTGTSASSSVATGQAVVLNLTTAQSGVTFRIRYDSQTYPSKIDLPTTSVISINSVNTYDAAYSGGTQITSATNGDMVYIRAVVSDPFGYDDITSMSLNISGPGGYSVTGLTATSVATSGCTRTYEYAWQTPTIEGTYTIVANSKEGHENLISDTKSTQITLLQTDLGTPCETRFANSSWSTVTNYAPNSTIYVEVNDADQDLNPSAANTIQVTLSTSTDSETLTLTETGNSTGIFRSNILSNVTAGTGTNDGTLNAPVGSVINLNYVDPNDPGDICSNNTYITNTNPSVGSTKVKVAPSDNIATVGEMVSFNITLSNTGPTNITQLTLTDTYDPLCLDYVSASVSPNTVNEGTGTLIWNSNIVPINVAGSRVITVYFTVISGCGARTNSIATTNGLDQNSVAIPNTNASASVTLTEPELTISKTRVSPLTDPSELGAAITYDIQVSNTGTTTANTVPLQDYFSDFNLTYVSAQLMPAASNYPPDGTGAGLLLWNNIGPINAGNSVTIRVSFTAKNSGTNIPNRVVILGAVDANGDAIEDVEANESTLDIIEHPIVGLAKNKPTVVNNGNGTITVDYLLTIENFGNVALSEIKIFDNIVSLFAGFNPTGFQALKGTLAANPSWDGTAASNIVEGGQSIAVGASKNVTIRFTANSPTAQINNTATVNGTSPADSIASDISQNGMDPDSDNDNDPIDNNDPTPLNTPPVAINDVNVTMINTAVSGQVLTNDSDPEGNTLTVTAETKATSGGGVVTINANGTYTYTPASNYTGEDTFTYTVCDNYSPAACATATVTIEVMPKVTNLNDPPVAVNDYYQGTLNSTISGTVLVNDFDPDSPTTLTVISATYAANNDGFVDDVLSIGSATTPVYGFNSAGLWVNAGTLTLNSIGTFVFVPSTGFVGDVSFSYIISDGALTDNADVKLKINPNPQAGNSVFALADAGYSLMNNPISGNVLTNDYDPQGNTMTISSPGTYATANGSITIGLNGAYTYTPNNGWTGTDTYTYTVCDNGTPQACDNAAITFTVYPTPSGTNPPVAQNDAFYMGAGAALSGTVATNDSDPDGDLNATSFTLSSGGSTTANGTLVLNSDGTFAYTPNAGFTGQVSFTYQVCDQQSTPACDIATVYIDVIGGNTVFAEDDAFLGVDAITISGNVLTNDNDPEGNTPLTATVVSGPSNGTLTSFNGATGVFVYTPNTSFKGTDTFVYKVCDSGNPSVCDYATVYIQVAKKNKSWVISNKNIHAK